MKAISPGLRDARVADHDRERQSKDTIDVRCPVSESTGNSSWLKAKMDVFQAKCRAAGLKITPQRMTVYQQLVESKQHPSADMLYRKVRKILPSISLDTVNRTLLTLARIGMAFVVEGSGDVKRFDANLENHQHFKCIKCKRIIDFYHKPFDNIPVPRPISRKFTVLKKTVYFEGICDLCAGKPPS